MIYKAIDYWNSPSLEHYGVKGMKWGRRKQDEYHSSRITYRRSMPNRFLSRISKRYKKEAEKFYYFNMRDENNKNIGDFQLYQENPKSTNIVWLGVNKKYQHKGYAREALEFGEDFAKKLGSVQITAEVVGETPEINHLVDQMGYIRLKDITASGVQETWGGLTNIKKDLSKNNMKPVYGRNNEIERWE